MKTKYTLIAVAANMLFALNGFSQSADHNYIRTRTYTSENGTAYLDAVQYFDGLGRPEQTVQKGITPQRNDLATLHEYDAFGRETAQWLPAKGTGSGAYTSPATVKTNAATLYGDAAPFSRPVYEASPLNRVLEQYAPGSNWHSNGKSVKTAYKANTASGVLACALYHSTIFGSILQKWGNYPANQLYVTETKDEGGNITYTFTDKLERTLLVRAINSGVNHDTYYVYDDYDNLRYVLPPLAADALSGNATWTDDSEALQKYGYVYKYDYRNRLTWKRLPGCEPVEYIYDRADRLIFQRDGELKRQNRWMFSIPDHFGRTVLTGTCGNTALGLTVSEAGFKNNLVKAQKRSGTAGGFHGYDILRDGTAVSASGLTILTVNWYDDYKFLERSEISSLGLSYDTGEGADYQTMYGATNDAVAHKGMLTGTATSMLNDNTLLYTAFYYDYRGQTVQTKSTNHLGGLEKEYIKYDFAGNVLNQLHVHSIPGKPVQRELYTHTYDHAGRLAKTTHRLNSAPSATLLAQNIYDEAGRMKSTFNNITGLVQYGYNVRSWLSSISSGNFVENLSYSYGGNITNISWRNSSGTAMPENYNLSYDNLSRLTSANYVIPSTGAYPVGMYSENFSYDKHGNILTLKRYAPPAMFYTPTSPGFLTDNLAMTYDGNRLKKVNDGNAAAYTAADSYFFMDWNPDMQTDDFLYNANGATIKDNNKGMRVVYNLLNLPQKIQIHNSLIYDGKINCYYSADGVKRKYDYTWYRQVMATTVQMSDISDVEDVSSPNLELVKSGNIDYTGNKIYVDGLLDKILLPNGYIKDDKYHFYLRDHLGNNRVVMTTERTSSMRIVTIQRTDYYPSGLPYPSMLNPQEQPYKFNGKEFDTMHGLNMYDYSARHYDAAIARWHVPDPLAEMRYSISPYAYTSNNPVSRTDPTGMLDDWYLNLSKGRVEYQEGSKDRFNEGLIHLAADNASIGDIENALSSKNFEYQKDASVEGGFRVDTEKQYKGWAMMQIFSPDNVSAIFGITAGTGGAAEKIAGRSAARGVSRVVAKEAAKTGAQGFKSFAAFKKTMGPAGTGQAWHHIVEKHADNVVKFGAEQIHNTKNVIKLPHGAGSIHAKITGHYNSLIPNTNMLVRDYVKTLSFEQQYQYGINKLIEFGWTP